MADMHDTLPTTQNNFFGKVLSPQSRPSPQGVRLLDTAQDRVSHQLF